jgi:hypothetical protein
MRLDVISCFASLRICARSFLFVNRKMWPIIRLDWNGGTPMKNDIRRTKTIALLFYLIGFVCGAVAALVACGAGK